jgi:hypothetical protein
MVAYTQDSTALQVIVFGDELDELKALMLHLMKALLRP